MDATRQSVGNDPGWDWRKEETRIRRMIYDWFNKQVGEHPALVDQLPEPFHSQWRAKEAAGDRCLRIKYSGFAGGCFVVFSRKAKAADAEEPGTPEAVDTPDTPETAPDSPPKPAEPPPKPRETPKRKEIRAIPFEPFDEASFPCRQFLYGKHYQRGQCTCSVGQDGAGKSTVSIGEGIAMATARNALNEEPTERCRVWIHNADDDAREVYRRIAAFCRHNGIPQEELRGWLFATGKDSFDIRVASGNGQFVPAHDTVAAITEAITDNQIDVAIFDPLVALHAVQENDNVRMSEVIHIFARIAANCDCAIDVAHHVRKPSNGSGDEKEFSSDDARGASAVRAAVRASRVFNRMSRAEAVAAGVSPEERARYIRIDRGKANYLPPAIKGTWFHLANVQLANGDQVGVIEPWQFPGQEGVSEDLEAAQRLQEHVFLEILRRFNETNRPASEKTNSTNYAPKVFALEEEAKLAKLAPAYLEAAMRRLLKRKTIKPVDLRLGTRSHVHTLVEVVGP
jgi:RecA-family ATPase